MQNLAHLGESAPGQPILRGSKGLASHMYMELRAYKPLPPLSGSHTLGPCPHVIITQRPGTDNRDRPYTPEPTETPD